MGRKKTKAKQRNRAREERINPGIVSARQQEREQVKAALSARREEGAEPKWGEKSCMGKFPSPSSPLRTFDPISPLLFLDTHFLYHPRVIPANINENITVQSAKHPSSNPQPSEPASRPGTSSPAPTTTKASCVLTVRPALLVVKRSLCTTSVIEKS